MPTQIDDLKVGDWVVVIDAEYEESYDGPQLEFGMFGPRVKPRKIHNSMANPVRILAINLPFLCCYDPATGNRGAIDVRGAVFQRCTWQYVKAMVPDEKRIKDAREAAPRKRKKKKKPDPDVCKNCGGRFVQVLVEPGQGVWQKKCPQCGRDGGPPTTLIVRGSP